mmetsp:Transcript_8184/g.12965  ORF Transcript_8184/g.12965 Transcript_8184/m.12965 type:complete len:82 (-) Transcript_8184:41-286(-)
MFQVLRLTVLQEDGGAGVPEGPVVDYNHPPAGWIPPLGASRKTWANVLKNKENIDYCTTTFHYLGNRLRCLKDLTGGPFLA